jgi:hypothetical protein
MKNSNMLYYKASKSKLLRPILSNVYLSLFVHWFFQSILAMDHTERVFKIVVDGVLTVILYLILNHWFSFIIALSPAWVLAHTVNFLSNGSIFALLKCFGNIRHEREEFEEYINSMRIRIKAEPELRWAAIYGSLSRGELNAVSDLDLRVIRYPGFINGLRACFFIMGERTKANIKQFPLDILLLDNPGMLQRMRADETPFVIYDASLGLSKESNHNR